MVYGIIGMINFAHGEVYMIGSYVAFIAIAGKILKCSLFESHHVVSHGRKTQYCPHFNGNLSIHILAVG
jgi:ABC-type branched-subunit amino acid transport system permease subunit